ncbi:hypothetical protein [Dethiothermospora halolimnae]|uniref:hypothetical protein n=1 Tax=Dethiothermospora halolimnae TaxID=3114390 RepID=UPI003CCBC364
MKWQEVRNQHPNQWVLVEALKASSHNNKRKIEDMAVISEHTNSTNAWKGYKELHLANPGRELYIFHTSNEKIEVVEDKFTGIRRRNPQ